MNRCFLQPDTGRRPALPAVRRGLPQDLRECVEPGTLMTWVQEAVLELNWGHPLVVNYLRYRPDDRPQVMLTLIAYAFLTRTASSEWISSACRTERDLHILSEGSAPFPLEIRAFRRKNRRLLQHVMGRVIERVLHKQEDASDPAPPGVTDEAQRQAIERLDLARHMDSGDA